MGDSKLHHGHRDRLRSRFLDTGIQGFQEHELLELLLFYAVPRRNTNELSHNLIDRFGSLKEVLEASADNLSDVKGIKDASSFVISFAGDLCRKYSSSADFPKYLSTDDSRNDFLLEYFNGTKGDLCVILNIGSKDELLGVHCFPSSSLTNGELTARDIAELAVRNKFSRILIGQNKSNGSSIPDESDYLITKFISETLLPLGINIADHIICGNRSSFSMRKSGAFSFDKGGRIS